MKILIPTDFSDLSKIAVQYVIGLSKDIHFDLVLLHFVHSDAYIGTRLSSRKLKDAIKASSEDDMDELINNIKMDIGPEVEISSEIVFGSSIANEIELFATQNNIDMICIGTKGVTGLKKILLGNNAAGIIDHSSIPVLTIPEYATYEGVQNIVYSSDLKNLDRELEFIIPFAKMMDAWIHVLHIEDEHMGFGDDLEGQENRLKTEFSYKKIKVKQLKNDSIIKGINQFAEDVGADIVAMFTHHTTFLEKLLHKSVSQNAAFQTKIPLLTFQKVEPYVRV